jgi:hypothetical protein
MRAKPGGTNAGLNVALANAPIRRSVYMATSNTAPKPQ